MKSAPVFFTIAQVQFNSILSLDSYAPRIQEGLRKDGFPDAQKGVLATVNLNLNPAASADPGQSQIPITQTSRYIFSDMARTSSFILDQGALSFLTTEYDVFQNFSGQLLKGLVAVNEAVGLSYTDRIGLRYLDAVFPKQGESLSDYLCGSMLCLTQELPSAVIQTISETLLKTDGVNVRARTMILDGEIGFPPDLQPPPKLPERFRSSRGLHAILDTDGWFESREAFRLEHVRKQLDSIHTEIERVFRATVTERALKSWE